MRRLSLLVLASLWFSGTSAGGVSIGGSLPKGIIANRMTTAQRLALRGQIKAVRWVRQDGRSVTRSVRLPLGKEVTLEAPAGEWTDLVLIFDGAVTVTDGAQTRALELLSLEVPLEEPLLTRGGAVVLALDLAAPDGLWSGAGAICGDEALAIALADGALGRLLLAQ